MTQSQLPHRGNSLAQIVLFVIEGRYYGLSLDALERVLPMVDVSPLPSAPEALLGVIDYHGDVLPVMDLRPRMALPRRAPKITDKLLVVTTRRKLAIAVDEVIGVREVASGKMRDPAVIDPGLSRIAGIATLEEGLVIIHDMEALLSADEEQELCQALREAGQ